MADFGPHDNLPRLELGPANPGPTLTINRQAPARDVLDVLPAGAPRKRWITLNQRVADISAAKISFDQQKAAAQAVTAHRRRVDDLLRPRNEGCLYGVAENSPFVAEREKLARAEVERDRLKKLGDVRSVRWNQYGNLRNRIADWVLRGGVSGGCFGLTNHKKLAIAVMGTYGPSQWKCGSC